MSRPSSPEAHWDRLEVWLNALTSNLLHEPTGDLQNLSQEQIDDNLSILMAHDPTQDYSHKELAKITASLAHNLLGQAKLSEATIHHQERQTAALKLQDERSQRNLTLVRRQLEQLTLETQDRTAHKQHPELQEELERLQNTLTDLRVDTAHREEQEKDAREELSENLNEAKTLLMRAVTELKEREAWARACEGHLQTARAEVSTLSQQRNYLKDELDTVRRELKHSYRLTSPASIPNPPPAARGWEPSQRLHSSHGVSTKELDKLARNIPIFTPNPAGGHDVHSYLDDVDFHLQTVANVTTRDRLYLLRITASREVRSFLDRQPESVKMDHQQLQQALIREFSDPESEHGLITAMDLKQGRQETTQAYYNRLRQAYFGARNEPGMEDDFNFRSLFLRNLHPTVSHYLGVLACPRTMSTQQLRDLAHKAFAKQRAVSEKTAKTHTIYPVSTQSAELTLEGAEQSHHDNRWSRTFPANRGQRGHDGARHKHQTGHSGRSWDRSQPPSNPRDEATWEGKRRPRRSQFSATQASRSDWQQPNPSQHSLDQSRFKSPAGPNWEATSEAAEIMRVLKELLQERHQRGGKKDESDQA
uniref:Retrotransposon gag domain-containing protein n=1 Tax=Denticeps clupeoides TaxID=299321 RepID=A0AAY4B215_9TELE